MAVKRKTFRKAHKTHHKKSKSSKIKTRKFRALRKQRKSKKGKKQKRKSKKRKNYKKGGAIPTEYVDKTKSDPTVKTSEPTVKTSEQTVITLRNSQVSCSEKKKLYNPDVDGIIIDENTPDDIVEKAMNDCNQLNSGPEKSDCEKVVLRKRKRVTKLGDLFEKLSKGEITSEAMATQLMPMVNMVDPTITYEDFKKGLENTDHDDREGLAEVAQGLEKIQEMTEELREKYNFKSELYQCKLDEQPEEVVGGGEQVSEKCDSIINEYTGSEETAILIFLDILLVVCGLGLLTYNFVQGNRRTKRQEIFGKLFESGCDIRNIFDSLTGIKGYNIKNLTKLTDKTLNKIKFLYIKSIIKDSASYYSNSGCKIKTQKNDVIIRPKYTRIELRVTDEEDVDIHYIEKVYLINYDKINNKIQLIVIKQKKYNPLYGYKEPSIKYGPYGLVNTTELRPIQNNPRKYFKKLDKDRTLHPFYKHLKNSESESNNIHNHKHFKNSESESYNIDLELNDKEMNKLGKKINNIQSCSNKEEINDIQELTQTYINYLKNSEIAWGGYKILQKIIDEIKKFHPGIKLSIIK